MKQCLSALDLASLLGITTRTLRNWAEDGSGPKREVRDLEPVYPLVDLVPWLKQRYPHIKLGNVSKELTPEARGGLLELWEKRLCHRYGLKITADLFDAVRHADFHETWEDPLPFWTRAAFAAFDGTLPKHRLKPQRLRELLKVFHSHSDPELAAKKKLTAAQFAEAIKQALSEVAFESFDGSSGDNGACLRQARAYNAIAFRYACVSAGRYDFPNNDPYIAGRMTPTEQQIAFGESGYIAYVMEKGLPACRWQRLACERQLDDLIHAREKSTPEVLNERS